VVEVVLVGLGWWYRGKWRAWGAGGGGDGGVCGVW